MRCRNAWEISTNIWKEKQETQIRNVLPACGFYPHVYEPVLCMFVCVSPPQQHGQASNQALFQPQHLCLGQTVSGAAQVADISSHECGSRDARQEAQRSWERQLCKLRRDVWQHLTPSYPFISQPPSSHHLPSPHLIFLPTFFILASACYLLDWHEETVTFHPFYFCPTFTGRELFRSFILDNQTLLYLLHCNSGASSDTSLCSWTCLMIS